MIGFDTETVLIGPGRLAPPLVCVSTFDGDGNRQLLNASDGVEWFRSAIETETLVAHNASFDCGVMVQACPELMPLVWDAYRDGRIVCTQVTEQLIQIASGTFKIDPSTGKRTSFSLAECMRRYFDASVDGKSGDDIWRTRYHELIDVPISEWPEDAASYALLDAEYAYRVCVAQKHESVANVTFQAMSAFALHLVSSWGLRTDPEAVDALEARLTKSVDSLVSKFVSEGIYRLKKDGTTSKNMSVIRARVSDAFGGDPPLTAKGSVSTSAETLLSSKDPLLEELSSISNDQKLLSTYIPVLRSGTEYPINPRYWIGETGRTTCRKPNIQNQPRKGGVRECYVPRAGFLYLACDYHIAELCCLAQVLIHKFGSSAMADAINSGKDLHIETASRIMSISYEEALGLYESGDSRAREMRQLSKACNFGFPGGLGAETFCDFAQATYGVEITIDESKKLKADWLNAFPEMKKYFQHISEALGFRGSFTARHIYSNRLRGDVGYTDGCNTFFQGLCSDGARNALTMAVRASFTPDDSFYGARVVAFIHDELLCEVPESRGHEYAMRLQEIMIHGMKAFCPDVKIRATPHLMDRWYKNAEPKHDGNGRLIAWTPD